MSNLNDARKALLTELKHVEEGVVHYQRQAAALRAALEQLDSLTVPAATSSQKASKPRKAGKPASRTKDRKASSAKSTLPKTSQDFWLKFIGKEPKTAAEIGNAAVESLGFTPTAQQTKQLKSRLAPTLHALLKAGHIQDTGAGRNRQYTIVLVPDAGAVKGKSKTSTAPAISSDPDNGKTIVH